MFKESLEITIPVLNEQTSLKKQILIIHSYLKENFNYLKWQIIIADNGSTDKTIEIGKKLSNDYQSIKYLRLDQKGVGLALKTSWQHSTADIIGYMDLDVAVRLNHLNEAISAIIKTDYDIVYATRLHKDSNVIGRSIKRELISRIFNLILKFYLGIKFSDGMCGFKFIKRNIVENLINNGAVSNGWFFSTELLIIGEKLGYKIFELPVYWTDSANSHVKIFPLSYEYIKAMKLVKNNSKYL